MEEGANRDRVDVLDREPEIIHVLCREIGSMIARVGDIEVHVLRHLLLYRDAVSVGQGLLVVVTIHHEAAGRDQAGVEVARTDGRSHVSQIDGAKLVQVDACASRDAGHRNSLRLGRGLLNYIPVVMVAVHAPTAFE